MWYLIFILLSSSVAYCGVAAKWFWGFSWPEYKTYQEIKSIRKNVEKIARSMDSDEDDIGWSKSYDSDETKYYDGMREYYEEKYGTDKAVALALIKTSERYKFDILNVNRMVYKETCPIEPLTDGEIDVKTLTMVKQIGFVKKSGGWTYDGYSVKMGTPRPIPISVKKYPRQSKAIEVSFSPKINPSRERIAHISVATNLPDGFDILVQLNNERVDSLEFEQNATVKDGKIDITFGSTEMPLPKGIYSLSFSGYILGQEHGVAQVVGNRFERLCGRYSYVNWGLGNDVQAKKLIFFEVR